MNKVVHIVGKGLGWELAPKEGEIWGVNDLVRTRDVTRVFHIHSDWLIDTPYNKKIIERINALKIPLMGMKKYPEVPTSVIYPIKEVTRRFGADYFTNSIDYMLAYALYVGMKEIRVYGVNMEQDTEYLWQKPGVEFWVGYAKGMGVKVELFGKHCLILLTRSGKLYGFWKKQEAAIRLIEELRQMSRDKKLQACDLRLYERFVLQKNKDRDRRMKE